MFEVANTLIEDRLRALWTGTEVDWDNVEFTPVLGVPFVRLQIEWIDANSISIGGLKRGDGYINLSSFVAANTGTLNVSTMCDQLSAIFDRWDTGQLKFKVAHTVRVGGQEKWYRRDVIAPFTYHECL